MAFFLLIKESNSNLKFNPQSKDYEMYVKKKILYTAFVSSLAVVAIFGISTNLLAFPMKALDAKIWKELTTDMFKVSLGMDVQKFWDYKTDDLPDGTKVFIPASVSVAAIKAGHQIYGLDLRDVGDITLTTIGGHDISGYAVAVPEPAELISLGLILLILVAISKKRFTKSSF